MKLTAKASAHYDLPREELFPLATDTQLVAEIVRPFGPLPGVESAKLVDATHPAKGVQRFIGLTDNTAVTETITLWDPPRVHAYRIDGFRGPFSMLVTHIDSRWDFCPLEKNKVTRIDWTYEVHLTSRLALPAALPLVKGALPRFLQQALDALKTRLPR